jgi:hypothetical protein
VTPPEIAERLARRLTRSRVVLIEGLPHYPSGLSHMACCDRIINAFLDDPDDLPALDTSCLATMAALSNRPRSPRTAATALLAHRFGVDLPFPLALASWTVSSRMLRVLLCSERDLRPELSGTLIGRQGIELYRAERFEDARLLCTTLGVRVLLVDRDLPAAAAFIQRLRQDPVTRQRSIAVLARGEVKKSEVELLTSGANAIFRLPPDSDWDDRLQRLLSVPVRHDARLVVRIEVDTEPECAAAMLNLSAGGMLLATHHKLRVNDELGFRFRVPYGTSVEGRARVAREAPPTGYGVEFLHVSDRNAIGHYLRSARVASGP